MMEVSAAGEQASASAEAGGDRIVGIDVGGTKIAAGWIDRSGSFADVQPLRTARHDGEMNLQRIYSLLADPALRDSAVLGVSVAVTMEADGTLRDPQDWFGWANLDLAAVLTTTTRRSYVFPDVECGAIAEFRRGAGRGTEQLLYVTVGTGISHCVIWNGKPISGAHGTAYFSGYTSPARCDWADCRARFVEDVCSGPAIAAAFAGTRRTRDSKIVFDRAARGDGRAQEVISHAAWHLGVLVADLVHIHDPDRVVIGGGLGAHADSYREEAVRIARERIITPHGRALEVVPASLGEMSCWIGSAELAADADQLATRKALA
jgi:glucokinase